MRQDEATPAALGVPVNPADPNQAIPFDKGAAFSLDEISRFGKSQSYEGFTLEALLALAQQGYKSILQSEISTARLYGEWGAVLLAVRKQHHEREKVKPRKERQGWLKFVAAQGWNQKRVDKAGRIRREHPTPEALAALDDKTVDEALNYASEEGPTRNTGNTYIYDDGRVVYYGFYNNRCYLWDGKTIECGKIVGGSYEDWPEPLEPPTQERLKAALAKFEAKSKAAIAKQHEHWEQDDQGDDTETETTPPAPAKSKANARPNLTVVGKTDEPDAEIQEDVARTKQFGAQSQPTTEPEGWDADLAANGLCPYCGSDRCTYDDWDRDKEEEEVSLICQCSCCEARWDEVYQFVERRPELLDEDERKPPCQDYCRKYLSRLRKHTAINAKLDITTSDMGFEVRHNKEKLWEGSACCEWAAQANAIKALARKDAHAKQQQTVPTDDRSESNPSERRV